MSSPHIERDLKAASVAPTNDLPSGFSRLVLARARAVKRAARIHWRLLATATAIAVIGAFLISGWLARQSHNTPPSIPVFDSNSTLFSVSTTTGS